MSHETKPECAGYLMLRQKYWSEDVSPEEAACHGDVDWEVEGKHYCVMHAPTKDKTKKFGKIFQEKLAAKDYNFRGVWFPDDADFGNSVIENEAVFSYSIFTGSASFYSVKFSGEYADFHGAQFNGPKAQFSGAKFTGECSFQEAQFNDAEAWFMGAQFSEPVFFSEVLFNGYATFIQARFSKGANFNFAKFRGGGVNFYDAKFARGCGFHEVEVTDGKTIFNRAEFSGGDASFNDAQFSGGETDFSESRFSGGKADFSRAQFTGGKADFSYVLFNGEATYFSAAHFTKDARFEESTFVKETYFPNSVFEKQVFFDGAEFKEEALTDLRLARFMDFTRFMGLKIEEGAEFYFGETTFEKPERVHFHSIKNLCPRWFINLDTRKFNFESVDFPLLGRRMFDSFLKLSKRLTLSGFIKLFRRRRKTALEILKWKTAAETELTETEDLLKRLKKESVDEVTEPPHKLLITAYRRLASNAEENNRYEEAMGFRYLAMETQRRSALWRRFLPVTLHWWYWASSGYGERAWRAGAMLALVWLIPFLFYVSPAAVFTRVETKRDEEIRGAAEYHESIDVPGMPPGEAVLYGLNTMAFQKPEPKAAKTSPLTQWIIFAQTILGPLQAALLALAIRRKFMR